MPSTTPLQLQLFPAAGNPRPAEAAEPPAPAAVPAPAAAEQTAAVPGAGRTALLERLQALRPGRFRRVQLTDNRSTIISSRQTPGGALEVRIHRSFAGAPDDAVEAVAEFLLARRRSTARARALAAVRDYFRRHQPAAAAPRPRRRIVLRPVGESLDLRQLRDEINHRYFDRQLAVDISWGPYPSRRRRRRNASVRLGTYSYRDRLVRIHRCLDRADVPRRVVESVVYHEMLHAALPAVVKNGRRRIHTPEFRRRERLFDHHEEAQRWIELNLARLLQAP